MRSLLLISLCLLCISAQLNAQEIILKGQLIDESNSEGIPYGMIFNETTEKEGTTSDEKGFFQLRLSKGTTTDKIVFSCLGYKVKTLLVSELNVENLKVSLTPSPFVLPDYVFEENDFQLMSYGDTTLSLKSYEGDDEDYAFHFESLGKGYGVFVDPARKDKGYFKSISIFITPKGKPQTPLALRILLPNGNMQNGQMVPLSNFTDILTENVILKPEKPGWNEVNFEDLGIPIPKGKFLVIFYPLEQGEAGKWTENGKDYYGSVIGIYQDYEIKSLNAARQIGGTKFAFLKPFGVNKFNIPAMVINWYKDQ